MEKETRAPLSAEQYIIDNWGVAWALKSKEWYTPDVIEALEDYSTQQTDSLSKELETEQWACARITAERDGLVKELEEDKWFLELSDIRIKTLEKELDIKKEEFDRANKDKILLSNSCSAWEQQYQELKAATDKLLNSMEEIYDLPHGEGACAVSGKALREFNESLNESK